jgi:hypothetical protein
MTVVTPTTNAAPAGWYRDPLGIPQLRWWNGIAWTNHIQDNRPEFQTWSAEYATAGSNSSVA